MSQLKIAMKKNKKLVINIALRKEDVGSLREEKESSESSERPRDVCSRAQGVDDHSSVRDGMMREVDVGTGLSGALNLLREQGTFKGETKLVGGVHEADRFRDGFKDIQIQRVDKSGKILTQKEAYRSLCHGFHGKTPGKRKQEKRKKKLEDKSKQIESSQRAVERMRGNDINGSQGKRSMFSDGFIFQEHSSMDPKDYYQFTEFVERVLREVGSFHLCSVNSYDETLLISWLSNVFKRNLQRLVTAWNFKTNELQLSVLRYMMDNAEILGSVILSTPTPITEEAKAPVLSYPKASPHAFVLFE